MAKIDLALITRDQVSQVAFKILHVIQGEELQYAAPALCMVLEAVSQEKNLSPAELMTTATNMLQAEGFSDDAYVKAVRSFVRDELPDT